MCPFKPVKQSFVVSLTVVEIINGSQVQTEQSPKMIKNSNFCFCPKTRRCSQQLLRALEKFESAKEVMKIQTHPHFSF